VISGQVACKTREDLSLSCESPEGTRVEDSGAIACERSPIFVERLRMLTLREAAHVVHGDAGGQMVI
jgi:hypothetical protein